MAAWTDERRGRFEYRPAALPANLYCFAQHAADHRPAPRRAAWPGSRAGSAADLRESIRAALDRLDDDAPADFVAKADGTVRFEDRPQPVLFCLFRSAQM